MLAARRSDHGSFVCGWQVYIFLALKSVVETSISIDQQARDNYQFDIMQVIHVVLF